MNKTITLIIAVFLLISQQAIGDTGVWVKGNWAQINTYCSQTYICTPKNSILHTADSVVKVSDPKIIFGVCNTAGGAIDSCNVCSSTPPNETCSVWVEKKN